MGEAEMVLEALQNARELVRKDWGSSNEDVPWDEAKGRHCASVAIIEAVGVTSGRNPVSVAAHKEILRAVGINPPADEDQMFACVYQFNDDQLDRKPVLAAFDAAIERLQAGPTPNADLALEVMDACDKAGAVIARQIVSEHPHLDEREIASVASAELFYAAQDTARASSIGVTFSRS